MAYLDKSAKAGKYFVQGDPLDLPKAMLYGVKLAKPGTETAVNNRMSTFRADKKKWNENAEKLLVLMGMEAKTLYTTKDLEKLAKHFTDFNFTLYTKEKGEKVYKPSYSTGDEGTQIELMVYQGSYGYFKSTRNNRGFNTCEFCREMYKKQITHACKDCCPKCRYPLTQCSRGELSFTKVCGICNRMFHSEVCYENHLKKFKTRQAACEVFKKYLSPIYLIVDTFSQECILDVILYYESEPLGSFSPAPLDILYYNF